MQSLLASRPLKAALLVVAGALSATGAAQGNQPVFDIGTDGTATITGAVNGSVIVNPSLLTLQVTANFGELSPINASSFVRIVVPVIIRTEGEYQVVASVTGSNFGTSGDDLRLADIGLGIINLRRLARGEECAAAHTVSPPFNTDPQLTFTANPRVAYAGNLGLLTSPRVVLTGPIASARNVKLNPNNIPGNQRDNGWAFDLVLTAAPQFFPPAAATATLNLSISQGPALACD